MKLTQNHVDSLVLRANYFYHGTLTLCVLDLINGAVVVGQSNVIDSYYYDQDLGEGTAYKDALGKIWQLEGYAMKTRDIHG